MRLNLEKSIFGVQGGKFLGFMLTRRGIEPNPEKCVTIIEMRSLNTLKEVRRLIGQLTTLSRFLPRATNTTKPFFKLVKKHEGKKWNEECEAHFQKLIDFFISPPILTRPRPGKDLILLLVVSKHDISFVIVVKEEKKKSKSYLVC